MKRFCTVRAFRHLPRLVLALAFFYPVCSLATDATIVRVEEDWELVVSTPETNSNSPQITCSMSPVASDDHEYMSFELNHQSQPSYAIGGLHLLAWNGDYSVGSSHTQPSVPLDTADELVSWTQSMTVTNGSLTYEISNGSSTTWGTFGTGELTLATAALNLNSYDYQQSLASSGVGFGANRVASLTLKRVRYITDAGQTYELTVDRNVLEVTEVTE